MSSVNKLLSKINQATTAIKSVKGISSKIFGTGYQSDVSKFEQDSLEYQTNLATRAKALKESSSNSTALSRQVSGRTPPTFENKELIYPVDYTVENYVHFTINPRNKRDEETLGTETTHIYLYAPNIQDNAPGVSYKNLEYGNVQRGLLNSERVFSSEMMDALSAEFTEAVAKTLNRIALNTLDFDQKRVINPQLEIMFDGMTFRTFDMQFQFRPNSKQEADKVREIIYELKTAMLPDAFQLKEGSGVDEYSENYFNRPNLFNIEYVGPIADKVDGFLPAFLTACNVTYNGGGKMETFTDGTPLIIDMTLSFQENVIMTQEQYQTISSFGQSSSVEGESAEGGESADGEVPVVSLPSSLPSGNRGGFSGNIPFGGG